MSGNDNNHNTEGSSDGLNHNDYNVVKERLETLNQQLKAQTLQIHAIKKKLEEWERLDVKCQRMKAEEKAAQTQNKSLQRSVRELLDVVKNHITVDALYQEAQAGNQELENESEALQKQLVELKRDTQAAALMQQAYDGEIERQEKLKKKVECVPQELSHYNSLRAANTRNQQDIEEMRRQNGKLLQIVLQLQDKLEEGIELKEKYDSSEAEKAELLNLYKNLKSDIADCQTALQGIIMDMKVANSIMSNINAILQGEIQRLKTKQQEFKALQEEYDAVKAQKVAFREENEALHREIQALREDLHKERALHEAIISENKTIMLQLNERRQHIQTLEELNKTARAEREEFQEQNGALERQILELYKYLEKEKSFNDDLNHHNDALEEERLRLQMKQHHVKVLEDLCNEARAEKERLTLKNEALQQEIRELCENLKDEDTEGKDQ